jgi:hypothetical protein
VAGSCEKDNEPSDCVNGGEFLDQLRDYQLVRMDSALQNGEVSGCGLIAKFTG